MDNPKRNLASGSIPKSAPKSPASEATPQTLATGAFDIVALAASAGGLTAVSQVLGQLPDSFPAAIAIVQHLDPTHRSFMADILGRKTALSVKQAEAGEQVQAGTVYIAPPNYHLLVNPDKTLALTQTERVHFLRPSADLLFESVAVAYQDHAIAVVLTGTGNDGAVGVQAIHQNGGKVIAQDEETSDFFGMPGSAVETGAVDFVLPLSEIAAALMRLVFQG